MSPTVIILDMRYADPWIRSANALETNGFILSRLIKSSKRFMPAIIEPPRANPIPSMVPPE